MQDRSLTLAPGLWGLDISFEWLYCTTRTCLALPLVCLPPDTDWPWLQLKLLHVNVCMHAEFTWVQGCHFTDMVH